MIAVAVLWLFSNTMFISRYVRITKKLIIVSITLLLLGQAALYFNQLISRANYTKLTLKT
jgi:hypothetical protein